MIAANLIPLMLFCIALYLLAGATAAEALRQLHEIAVATNDLLPHSQTPITPASWRAWVTVLAFWPALLPIWLYARYRHDQRGAAR